MDKKNINEEFDLIDISGNDFVEELTIEESNVKANISNAEVKIEGNLSGKLDDNLNTNNSKVSDSVSPSTTSGEPVSSNENVNNNSTNNGYSPESIPKENVQTDDNKVNDEINNRNTNSVPNDSTNNFGPNRNSLNKQNNLPENNDSNNNLNNTPNIPQDNRSLKDKAKDAKDKINDTKDKIKNAPENIKNKIDDTKNKINNAKDKVNNAKDKIKNAPDNLKQKRDQVKDKWNNRPKNMKEAGNRAKDSLKSAGKGIKNKAKSGLKKGATKAKEKAKEGAKEGAKEAFNNSSVGQAVNKVKEVKDLIATSAKMVKKIISFLVKTFPYLEIAIGVILMIIVIATFAAYLMPGLFGDVNDSSKYEEYSKVDQKTLEEIRSIFASYPNADATLAMATVLYPYYSNLHDGNVTVYLKGISDSDNIEDTSEDSDDSSSKVGTDIENEDENEEIDFYLLPFRNSKVKGRLKDLLAGMGASGDNTTFENYVKDTYFKKDKGFTLYYDKEILTGYNGYKNMFKSLNDSANEDALEDAIIKELYDIKDMFINYVFENKYCSTTAIPENATAADTLYNEIMQGKTPYVNIKDTTAENFSNIKSAKSLYGTDTNPMELERYIMGVVYVEVGANVVDDEARAKAFMISAHSLLLGRTQSGRGVDGHTGKKFTPDYTDDGKVIFYIRGNTYDQDFCDVYEGCQNGSNYGWDKRNHDAGSGNPKPPVSKEGINRLKQWWSEIQNQYIYHSTEDFFGGSYSYNYTKYCKSGSCITVDSINSLEFTDYNELLFEYAYTDEGFSLYDASLNSLSSVAVDCTGLSSGNVCSISNEDFIYYSQKVGKYSNEKFCGRSDGSTIKQSGCGITSMAMVIANLADSSVTPLVTNEEAKSGAYCGNGISGTNANYFAWAANKYGLTQKSEIKSDKLDIDSAANQLVSTLRNGGLVIVNVNKSWLGGSSGHYIVVKGVTSDNKLIIADPYSDSLTSSPHNIEFTAKEVIDLYVDNGHGWYMFTSAKSEDIVSKYCSNVIEGEAGIASGTLGYPVEGVTGCDDSDYPNYVNSGKYHGGTDINKSVNGGIAVAGKAVYATDGGVVITAKEILNSYGSHVIIDHGNGFHTLYAHMKRGSLLVKAGDKVKKGQQIGIVGSTGNSTGPHLHIELRKNNSHTNTLNPCEYIGKNKSYVK